MSERFTLLPIPKRTCTVRTLNTMPTCSHHSVMPVQTSHHKPSPCGGCPSLMGERVNSATVGVPSARKKKSSHNEGNKANCICCSKHSTPIDVYLSFSFVYTCSLLCWRRLKCIEHHASVPPDNERWQQGAKPSAPPTFSCLTVAVVIVGMCTTIPLRQPVCCIRKCSRGSSFLFLIWFDALSHASRRT